MKGARGGWHFPRRAFASRQGRARQKSAIPQPAIGLEENGRRGSTDGQRVKIGYALGGGRECRPEQLHFGDKLRRSLRSGTSDLRYHDSVTATVLTATRSVDSGLLRVRRVVAMWSFAAATGVRRVVSKSQGRRRKYPRDRKQKQYPGGQS